MTSILFPSSLSYPSRILNLTISGRTLIVRYSIYEYFIYLFICVFFKAPLNIKLGMMQKETVMD
jgi:hypothetical protein